MENKRVNNPLAGRGTADGALNELLGGKEEHTENRGRKQNESLQRGGAVDGLPQEWTRATFIVRKDQLEDLKDYAYTERLNIKEVVEQMVDEFLKDKKDNIIRRK